MFEFVQVVVVLVVAVGSGVVVGVTEAEEGAVEEEEETEVHPSKLEAVVEGVEAVEEAGVVAVAAAEVE